MKISVRRRIHRAWPLAAMGLLALAIPLALAAGNPAMTRFKEALELTDYPPDWNPPPIRSRTPAGQRVSLAGLRGRVVLINFWASWCVPCRAEMADFEKLHRVYGAQGLTVLGVNIQEQPEVIRRFAARLGLTFPLVLDLDGRIAKAYGVIGLPSTFLVGRDGRPVALAIGEREWANEEGRAFIKVLLAAPASPASRDSPAS